MVVSSENKGRANSGNASNQLNKNLNRSKIRKNNHNNLSGKIDNTKNISLSPQREILENLSKIFPKAFGVKSRKPLKRGILKDICSHEQVKALGYTTHVIQRFMSWYVQGWGYLKLFQDPNAYRIDLDGNKVADITDDEREFSKQKLESSKLQTLKKHMDNSLISRDG